MGRQDSTQNYQGLAERPLQSQPQPVPPPSQPVPGAPPPGSDLSLNLRPSSRTTSAPSSPAKTRESLLQRVQSLTGAARDQTMSADAEYSGIKMENDEIPAAMQQPNAIPGHHLSAQNFLYVNTNEEINAPRLDGLYQSINNSVNTATRNFQPPGEDELLPVRMTEGSHYYTPAFRLDDTNVCPEAIEAILFDTLEGECILAEYQQNNFLSSTTQQKLTDVLLGRSSKLLMGKHVQKYFVKLTEAIIKLFPNEDASVYYIPPQSSGNSSKNPKGKLPDKWRNLTYQLRVRGILPKKKSKDQPTSSLVEVPKPQNVKDTVQNHVRALQVLREPFSEVLSHWEATYDYRKLLRNTSNRLDNILAEWPIIESHLGPQLVDHDFNKTFNYEGLMEKWTAFFDTLYDVKKPVIRDSVGKEYCSIYERLNLKVPELLTGIQIQLLPYLIPPTTKFKTGSGVVVKPTMWESSEGLFIYCKTSESVSQRVSCRSDRYRNWSIPTQPCIVLQGPEPCNITVSYVSLMDELWEVESPIRALDLVFKLYQVFNLQYPPDCEQLWLLIQKIVYEISYPFDKKITNVTSIANMLSVKLGNKRQRLS